MGEPQGTTVLQTERRGFLTNLVDVYVAPTEAFVDLLRKPRFWGPLLGLMALNLVLVSVWTSRMDAREFVRNQIASSPTSSRIPPERLGEVIDTQARIVKPMAWVSSLVIVPLTVAAIAGLFLFVFRFFYGAELSYPAALCVVTMAFLAVSLVTTPLILTVLSLRGDWNVDPSGALQANLSLLLGSGTHPALRSLASSLDLVTVWALFLLATGFGVASRRPVSSAMWGVAIPWALFVVVKVGFVALLS